MNCPSHHPGIITLKCMTARSQLVSHPQLLPKTLTMLLFKLATYKPDTELGPSPALSLHTPIGSTDFLYWHWLDSRAHSSLWLFWFTNLQSREYCHIDYKLFNAEPLNPSCLFTSYFQFECLHPHNWMWWNFLSPTKNIICGLMLIWSTVHKSAREKQIVMTKHL